ncbi:hypothetical protein BpHYR1_015939 [Brachionus plicatilis]|uniref:Uncharacterized protein n=1 Tax=Brachionus plicatilis TaxID=10195 RepID=A0A3M7S6F4_BRAPC|nr:hypothetical protein BpHYR1_015939 [Brachionus plicatilis]
MILSLLIPRKLKLNPLLVLEFIHTTIYCKLKLIRVPMTKTNIILLKFSELFISKLFLFD